MTPKNKRNEAAIYIEAACKVFEGKEEYSCCAISTIESLYRLPQREKYRSTMLFETSISQQLWNYEDRQNLRVWLLCMMSACCGDFE